MSGTGCKIDTRVDAISLVIWVSDMKYRVCDMGREYTVCGIYAVWNAVMFKICDVRYAYYRVRDMR